MVKYEVAAKAEVVTLIVFGCPGDQIYLRTGVSERTQNRWIETAIARGLDRQARPLLLLDKYFEDAPRTGRPNLKDEKKDEVLTLVRKDRNGRELTVKQIADNVPGIKYTTVWRILKEAGFCHQK